MPEMATPVTGLPETAAVAPARPLATPPAADRGSALASVGVALPERVVSNEEVASRLGVDGSWIESRTGVRERRIAEPGERLSAYAAAAADDALRQAGANASEIDLLLVATMTADEIIPNAAPLVAAELGASSAGTMDIGAACTGFLSALALACGQIESGRCERALVIGAELLSRVTDRDDRRTAGLFADGAGAVLVGSCDAPGRVGPAILGSDGAQADLIRVATDERLVRMNGHDTFKHAVARLAQVSREAADAAGLGMSEIDLFVFHQANSRIISAVGKELSLPPDRVIDCVPRFANTSAATIPIALGVAAEEGRLDDGTRVLVAAFGSGLTWGGVVLEWGAPGG